MLDRDDLERIFSDVPDEHKFWLKSGTEVKNLHEFLEALKVMDDATFYHHVDDRKNDFADWIEKVIKDPELADTMSKIKTRDNTITAVEMRIETLRNTKAIHEAIDDVREDITGPQVKENFKETLHELKQEKRLPLKRFITDYVLYVGILLGFVLGVLVGYLF